MTAPRYPWRTTLPTAPGWYVFQYDARCIPRVRPLLRCAFSSTASTASCMSTLAMRRVTGYPSLTSFLGAGKAP